MNQSRDLIKSILERIAQAVRSQDLFFGNRQENRDHRNTRKIGLEVVKSIDLFTPETPPRPILAGVGGWDTGFWDRKGTGNACWLGFEKKPYRTRSNCPFGRFWHNRRNLMKKTPDLAPTFAVKGDVRRITLEGLRSSFGMHPQVQQWALVVWSDRSVRVLEAKSIFSKQRQWLSYDIRSTMEHQIHQLEMILLTAPFSARTSIILEGPRRMRSKGVLKVSYRTQSFR